MFNMKFHAAIVIAAVMLAGCDDSGGSKGGGKISASWAASAPSASNESSFNSVTTDPTGNVYAAGYISGSNNFELGNGQTVGGAYAGGANAALVKYDSAGNVQWARSVVSAPGSSHFWAVQTDAQGYVYAAGDINSTGEFDFGNGQTAQGTASRNVVIVKYNASGVALWARSIIAGTDLNGFNALTVDRNGNVYAAGFINSTATYNFGNGKTAAGNGQNNLVLVKYDSAGAAQWAKSVTASATSPTPISNFYGAASDADGNIYAAGIICGDGLVFNFGNSVTKTGSTWGIMVLVKYSDSGTTLWAKTVAGYNSYWSCIAVDTDGNIILGGYTANTGSYDFGNSVTASGAHSSWNFLVAKYDSEGDARWASTTTTATNNSYCYDVSIDDDGNVYAVGQISGAEPFGFGNGVTVTGANTSSNCVLVKYGADGKPRSVKTVRSGPSSSWFNSVKTGSGGCIYGAGAMEGIGPFDFGDGVSASGGYSGYNLLLLQYN